LPTRIYYNRGSGVWEGGSAPGKII